MMLIIYISAAPEFISHVKTFGKPLLHMAYTFRYPFPENDEISGGMMAVYGDIRSSRSGDIVRECRLKGFSGVVAGYGYCSLLETMRLADALGRRSIRLYMMEENYCRDCGAYVVISTAVSGGGLKSLLKSAVKKYGASKIALDYQRLCHVFPLPSPDGNGSHIGTEEFEQLLDKAETGVTVSDDLCCKYFSFIEDGVSRFVLFDDLETLKMKITLAASLGINDGFVMYPEWDIDTLRGL